MMRSLWTAASGMVAQQANIDVVSNNLANVNTTGFKKSRSDFEDLMYQTMTIEGDGFFQITMADGTINYTRDGAFKRDDQGRIVTSEGYPLEPAITIPEGSSKIEISSDGRVSATLAGQNASQELGQIQLVKFVNPAGLDSVGHNLLKETAASGTPVASDPGVDGTGTIMQKYLEMSNVQVVEEMVNMIVAQRAYEINSKAITTSDNMLEQVANLKR